MLKELLNRFTPGPPDGFATVHLREGRLFIRSYDRTPLRTAGFWAANDPLVVVLEAGADAATVGQTVLDALARSRLEVPVPTEAKKLEKPLLKAAGVTSWRAFLAGARVCTVSRKRAEIILEPNHNGGNSGDDRGFTPLTTEHWLRIDPVPTADAMGRAVLAGLERSTIAPGV